MRADVEDREDVRDATSAATALASRSKRAQRDRDRAANAVGQDLDRDVAVEARVARAVDLAHAAGAEGGEDLVGAEAGSGG